MEKRLPETEQCSMQWNDAANREKRLEQHFSMPAKDFPVKVTQSLRRGSKCVVITFIATVGAFQNSSF